jgi:D-glycero-alpha-D-manno-heptose-7-phosphate kinase
MHQSPSPQPSTNLSSSFSDGKQSPQVEQQRHMPVVRSRAPLRLGLAGGGSDVSPYCDTFGGAVLNATIDRYATATFEARTDGKIVLISQDTDVVEEMPVVASLPVKESRLVLHRGVYNRMIRDYNGGQAVALTLTTHVESPMGSGLGSSSALVVAMVQLLAQVLRAPLGEYEVARLAYDIERIDLGFAGGRQDQYAAAFGGFNFLELYKNELVIVNPLRIKPHVIWELEASLLLVFTGASRESSNIISTQTQTVSAGGKSLEAMHQLKAEAVAMKEALLFGRIREVPGETRREEFV